MRARSILAVLLLGFTLACGGGSGSGGSTATGNLTLRFGSDSFPGFTQAVVSVEKVEASTDGTTWMSLGNVRATYDLMTLQNGHSAALLSTIAVPPATYTQFRITWATQNYANPINLAAYVIPSGAATGQPLSMPTTTVLPGSVTVTSGGSTTAQIMLVGQQAVQQRVGTPSYTFQATGQAYDLSKTASITGQLADGTTPLVGAEVYAETVDGSGTATIQRRAFTDGIGSYLLECLPAGASTAYFVVSQPASTLSAYAAGASSPINAVAGNTATANLAFSGAQQPGALTLTINPPSLPTVGTWGELRQFLAAGPGLIEHLIIRSQSAVTSTPQDQVYFTGLAPSYYGVTSERSTAGATPVTQVYGSQVQVSSGAIATASLSYP